MTELENKLVEKILEKLDMDKLTDKIAEKAAELIVQREYPSSPAPSPINPVIPNPINPINPWVSPNRPIEPIVAAYACIPTQFVSTSGSYKQEEE